MTIRPRRVALMASLALVTACGSTVAATGSSSTGGVAGGGPAGGTNGLGGIVAGPQTGPTSAATGQALPTAGAGAVGGPAAAGQDSAGTVAGGSGPAAAQGGTGARATGSPPGVTSTTVRFGAAYSTDTGAGNKALGGGQLDPGDARNYYNAVIEEANKTGGVAGRKLVPSYFEVKATSGESSSAQEQAACEKWTKDDPVFVVFDGNSENLRSCAERSGRLNLAAGASNSVARTFGRYAHYVEVSSIALDRAAQATVDGLATTDYFGPKPVIGIVAWDSANYRDAVQRALIPALKAHGYAATEPQFVKVPETLGQVSDSSAATSSAVLKFRSEGVDHVFIVDGPAGVFAGTGLTLLFVRSAGSQHYYPRYGLNDSNSPQAGIDSGLWTADDMRGARTVSWSNALDSSDAGVTPNAKRKSCLDLMKRHGISVTNAAARTVALRACEYVWFLRATFGTSAGPVDTSRFLMAVDGLGATYRSPLAYGTRFNRGRHDGIGAARRMALDDRCGCFRYTTKPYPLS